MRAPFQILAIPFRKTSSREMEFCVFHRSDLDQWQFIAGGGEDDETIIYYRGKIIGSIFLKDYRNANKRSDYFDFN